MIGVCVCVCVVLIDGLSACISLSRFAMRLSLSFTLSLSLSLSSLPPSFPLFHLQTLEILSGYDCLRSDNEYTTNQETVTFRSTSGFRVQKGNV